MKNSIPNLRLYGESDTDLSCEPVHVDDVRLSTRRSDWYIEPHRHGDLLHVIFFRQGSGRMRLEDEEYPFQSPVFILVPPAAVHSFRVSRDLEGELVTLTREFVEVLLAPSPGVKSEIYKASLMQGEQHQAFLNQVGECFVRLKLEYAERQLGRNLAIQSLLGNIFTRMLRYRHHTDQNENTWGVEDSNQWYFRQFQNLIGHKLSQKASIPDYAAEMRISAPHLNRICRQVAEKSALEVVHDRMISEAKRTLAYTMLSVSEVAYQLGFEDPSYFSHFFKAQTGLSPKTYKSQVRQRI